MTDKDSQLDAIERLAIDCLENIGSMEQVIAVGNWKELPLSPELFVPSGLYYEMRRENNKLFCNTGNGCSVCGGLPVVNVSGTYWLCGECASEKIEEPEQLAKLLNEREQECDELGRDLKEAEKEIKFLQAETG